MHLGSFQKETKFLSRLPGVAAIFLSGSRAQGRSKDTSDIDLFIIAHPGRIWTARFFVYINLFLRRNMRRPGKTHNTFCPNHFITTDHLEIQEKDPYSAHLFSHNTPLHDLNNIFIQFAHINQPWVKTFGESFPKEILSQQPLAMSHRPPSCFARITECLLLTLQLPKIQKNPDYKLPGAKIVLTDTELRFHPRPRNKTWQK